ncbi:putative nucleic acid-binding Zn-ribbon protein [Bacillus thuringiensis]
MSNSALLQFIKEARRDILVDHYIANNVPHDLTDKITDAESLYEYLLLDTKVSELVKTSPIAEAISSIQLYINRCIEGHEGELTPQSKSHFEPGKFLYSWDKYNKRYTTWAGKERLKYYAGSYIDPSLRYNKTDLFKNLEQSISQGKLTEENAKVALQKYLNEYEVLANLEYISVNRGEDESILFFVGRAQTAPYEYYWRRLTLKEDNTNKLIPDKWSQWKKITANIGEANNNYLVPYWYKNQLHIQWISTEKIQSDGEEPIEKKYINDWVMDSSGGWSPFKKFTPYEKPFRYKPFWSTIEEKHITYDGNQVFCNDPNTFRTNLTLLSDDRLNIYFETSKREHGVIYCGPAFLDISVNSFGFLLRKGERRDFVNPKGLMLYYLEENLEIIEEFEELLRKKSDIVKSIIKLLEELEELLAGIENFESLLYRIKEIQDGQKEFSMITKEICNLSKKINNLENEEAILYKIEEIQGAINDYNFITGEILAFVGERSKSSIGFHYLGQSSLYNSYGSISMNYFKPPLESNIKNPFYLSMTKSIGFTLSKKSIDLSILLEKSFDTLFDYNVQKNKLGGRKGFFGPYGLYLWEIFFHIPFLMATRFKTEQRYDLAERWFKFIFNSTGYRDGKGNLLKNNNGNVRYWNVVPLQEDTEWDETLSLPTTDPDEIAMVNPMQYKLAVFIRTIEFLIDRGDNAYRMLERDTLTEAKMYYIQAGQLLGSRPEIRINSSWPEPTLESEANALIAEPTRSNSNITPIVQFRGYLKAVNGHFLPPYNEELLGLWEKIELRLYNLRHNLSLDGQPLNLQLFSEPTNPRDLQIRYSTGDGLKESTDSPQSLESIYRFPIVIDKARTAVNSVIQFGNALENALGKQDVEEMTLLLQSQQQIILQQTRDIQGKNLASLQASLEATMIAKSGAELTKKHYKGLVENWMSDNETRSLSLRTDAGITNTNSVAPMTIAGAADMAPNVFGLANGGVRWGAVSTAVAQGLQISATVKEQNANIMDISESYRRRREDWMLQKEAAERETAQLDSQILALQEQINMANKQIVMAETEQAHAQAIYQLQSTRFTSQALYNWMASRLSSLYYQMYDASLFLCFMAKNALEKELGENKTTEMFILPAWNDLYQGLLAGEILMVELQKLENLWLEENKRGMEAVKTVSLDALIRKEKPEFTFVDLVQEVLNGKSPETVNGVHVQLQNNIFSATLDLSSLGLDKSYNQVEKKRRIKNLSVTLPALLGPYQDVEATLSLGGTTVTLSHGVDDSGLFITDLNDSRFLPFEGMDLLNGRLTLAIFHTGKDGIQRSLLESLNDVIFHIRYVMK